MLHVTTRQMGRKSAYVECQAQVEGPYGRQLWVGRMVRDDVVTNAAEGTETEYVAIRWKIHNGVSQGLYTYRVIDTTGVTYELEQIHSAL